MAEFKAKSAAEMRKLAEAATGEGWVPLSCPDLPTDCCEYGVVAEGLHRETARVWLEEDARFIAAANPSQLTAMCDLIEAQARRIERFERAVLAAVTFYDGLSRDHDHGEARVLDDLRALSTPGAS